MKRLCGTYCVELTIRERVDVPADQDWWEEDDLLDYARKAGKLVDWRLVRKNDEVGAVLARPPGSLNPRRVTRSQAQLWFRGSKSLSAAVKNVTFAAKGVASCVGLKKILRDSPIDENPSIVGK